MITYSAALIFFAFWPSSVTVLDRPYPPVLSWEAYVGTTALHARRRKVVTSECKLTYDKEKSMQDFEKFCTAAGLQTLREDLCFKIVEDSLNGCKHSLQQNLKGRIILLKEW